MNVDFKGVSKAATRLEILFEVESSLRAYVAIYRCGYLAALLQLVQWDNS